MNRALAFSAGDPGQSQAIRIRIDSVPAANPNLDFLVGSIWWAQPQVAMSSRPKAFFPEPESPSFWTSQLGCKPFYVDWHGVCVDGECDGGLRDGVCAVDVCASGANESEACASDADCPGEPCAEDADCAGGIINAYGEMVVPGASYTVSVIAEGCDLGVESNFTDGSLSMTTSTYGNVVGTCSTTGCTVPDDGPTGITDALAGLLVFSGSPNRPRKMRTDLEPSEIDFFPAISDILQSLNAFSGIPYPFIKCQALASGTRICFGGPTHLEPCQTSVDCQIPLCAGAAPE